MPLGGEAARAALEADGAYEHLPADGAGERLSQARQALARGIEHVRERLREGDAETLRREAEEVIRRRPIATVIAGAAVGFLVARLLRR
jgi:ElaB/YqjD/DUF883 family membrane-anchored ribosome-binding protein